MDASAENWLSDLEMEDYNLLPQYCHMNLFDDDEFFSHDIVSALHHQPLSPESHSSYHNNASNSKTVNNSSTDETCFERAVKQQKTKSRNSASTITEQYLVSPNLSISLSPSSSPSSCSSPTPQIFSFDNSNSPSANTAPFYAFDGTLNPKQNELVSESPPQVQQENMKFMAQSPKSLKIQKSQGQGTKRSHTHAQDHIMAERKRREKLSRSLIALAALIPGLKKMDKASVLADAIKYVKELQERLRVLEEESSKRELESVVIVNKPQVSSRNSDDYSSSSDESEALPLPQVEARVAEKEVLLRIHCHKQNGLLVKIFDQIQNFHLFVVNSSILPFGDSVLDITLVAQMGKDYNMTTKDLVKTLRVATLKSMS